MKIYYQECWCGSLRQKGKPFVTLAWFKRPKIERQKGGKKVFSHADGVLSRLFFLACGNKRAISSGGQKGGLLRGLIFKVTCRVGGEGAASNGGETMYQR